MFDNNIQHICYYIIIHIVHIMCLVIHISYLVPNSCYVSTQSLSLLCSGVFSFGLIYDTAHPRQFFVSLVVSSHVSTFSLHLHYL